eukprot:CAMPEP_0172815050 /NCGR_PEP_ID=MMETSP1075-20121228/11559_1 /TAXON_ID=2916 /ORGANISM="Ceratium fusus, Strain PA161109" /LENGTH=98 /DNA_ID=CAMNT_0013654881 /DNA_START=327 /DNA_END=624 /DNA_ORIENTATION=-
MFEPARNHAGRLKIPNAEKSLVVLDMLLAKDPVLVMTALLTRALLNGTLYPILSMRMALSVTSGGAPLTGGSMMANLAMDDGCPLFWSCPDAKDVGPG